MDIAAPGLALLSVSSHLIVLYHLARSRSQQPPYGRIPNNPESLIWTIRLIAILSATVTIALPYSITHADPLKQCGARVVCFFYACKILDLAASHAKRPPTLLVRQASSQEEGNGLATMRSGWDLVTYIWLLLTEMRYRSFDIAVKQKGRMLSSPSPKNWWLPVTTVPLLLPVLAYIVPTAESKCAALLLLIQYALEGLHRLLHLRCPDPLFREPFSAASLSDFWTTRWHASASPFLQSLAYRPIFRLTGSRAISVLAAFCLSGIWHCWASAPLVTKAWLLGTQVWALFMAFGVGCLLERWVWGARHGGLVQRVFVWAWSLGGAGVCWRTLERHSRLAWLRSPGED